MSLVNARGCGYVSEVITALMEDRNIAPQRGPIGECGLRKSMRFSLKRHQPTALEVFAHRHEP